MHVMRLLVTDEEFQLHPLPANNPGWELRFNYRDSPVVVRPVAPGESLFPIFRLIYEAYVEELRTVNPEKLPPECLHARAKWDGWDFLPCTRHYVALVNGAIVGHVRLIDDSDLGLPLEKTGFDLRAERLPGHAMIECSKLVIRREYRGSPILSALMWQAFQQKKAVENRPCMYLSCDPSFTKLYRRMGATEIGVFLSNEFDRPYSAMRLDLLASFNDHAALGCSVQRTRHMATESLSRQSLQHCADSANADIRVDTWESEPLAFGGSDVASVRRVTARGQASDGEAAVWSCITKEFSGEQAMQREVAAYLPESTPPMTAHLRMPRLLEVVKSRAANSIILEDVRQARSRALRVPDLRDFALELGKWHAAGAHHLKTHRSGTMAGRWLREYVGSAERLVSALPTYAKQAAMLGELLQEPTASGAAEIWSHRGALLAALDSLPQTYSHQDLVAGNVVVNQRLGESIYHLLDWATAGVAPMGAELGPLLVGNAILFNWSIQESNDILFDVIDAYRRGLHANNVHVSRDSIYFSLTASAAIRYIAWGGHRVGAVLDTAKHGVAKRVTGRSMAEVIANYCRIRTQLVEWGFSAIHALAPADLAMNG
jgi:predicted GNAT family N-acyltransferase